MSSSPPPAVEVDIENGSSSPPPVIPAPSFWSRFTEAVDAVEERIANFLGLNESKYQWAMDEYMKQQLSGDATATSTSQTASGDQPGPPGLKPTESQFMDRNSSVASS